MQSSKPYSVGLSFKEIEDILRMERPMDNDYFNLGIHIVACDEILHMLETDEHYMVKVHRAPMCGFGN
jgi:predicted XRE-type DNA-binding protein